MKTRFLFCFAVAVGSLVSLPALASESYAARMATVMPCTPQCTLCHIDNLGGIGRLSPFGTTMRTTGMLFPIVGDPVASLDSLGTADTDGDAATDIDEVHAGTNPSVAGAASLCGGPEYGCGASIARPPRNGLAVALSAFVALGLGALAFRRRGRQR